MSLPVTHLHPIRTLSTELQSKCAYLPVYVEISGRSEEPAKKDKSLWHELGGDNLRISIKINWVQILYNNKEIVL